MLAGKALEAFGTKVDMEYKRENPTLINDTTVTSTMKDVAITMIGAENVIDLPLELGAEDFSFYTMKVPSSFAIVGCAIEGSPREIHTSTFDIDEDALIYGTALLSAGALRLAG
jgi:amidohydrolase